MDMISSSLKVTREIQQNEEEEAEVEKQRKEVNPLSSVLRKLQQSSFLRLLEVHAPTKKQTPTYYIPIHPPKQVCLPLKKNFSFFPLRYLWMMGFARTTLLLMFFSAFLFHGLCVGRTKVDILRHVGEASDGDDEASAPGPGPGSSTPPSGGVRVQVRDKYVWDLFLLSILHLCFILFLFLFGCTLLYLNFKVVNLFVFCLVEYGSHAPYY